MGVKKIFLNGRFVAEEEGRISVLDRGFTYGDGLFETVRVAKGVPFRWAAHFGRLQRGLEFLRIGLPHSFEELEQATRTLIRESATSEAVLRLVVSRGVGPRGYSPRGAENPTVAITLHDPPQPPQKPLRLLTSSYGLKAGDPLLQHKTCNKLLHVMARAEAEQQGFDDALLLNERGEAVTATSANVFRIAGETVYTAPIAAGALPGITRGIIQEICSAAGVAYFESHMTLDDLKKSNAVFLTSSTLAITPVGAIDSERFEIPNLVRKLAADYTRLDS